MWSPLSLSLRSGEIVWMIFVCCARMPALQKLGLKVPSPEAARFFA